MQALQGKVCGFAIACADQGVADYQWVVPFLSQIADGEKVAP